MKAMSKVSYENSMWVLLDEDGNRHSFESKHELEQYLDLCDQYVSLRVSHEVASLDSKDESD